MTIPKKLKIGGLIYDVILKDRNKECGVSHYGTTDPSLMKIWIHSGISKQQQESTLIYEILEAINHNWELRLEHQQISQLETSLYQVLKDNNLWKN